ncbi:MAG TPA: hypothetical protein VGK34_09720 [Armatimonadota bacterium]
MSMKTNLAIALALTCGASAQMISSRASAILSLNDVRLQISTRSDFRIVAGTAVGINQIVASTDGQIHHRCFIMGEQYLGYDLELERVEGTKKFRLFIKPLSVDLDMFYGLRYFGFKTPAPLPSYPPPQEIEQGDRIHLDLVVNSSTGQKATDEIQILSVEAPHVPEPRDLQFDEIPVLGLKRPTLLEDGQVVGTKESLLGPGTILAMAVPGRGWIYLAIKPYEGYAFQRAGTVDGSRARFTVGGHKYELRSRDYILPRGGPRAPRNLYVLLDQKAPPTQGSFYTKTSTVTPGPSGQNSYPPTQMSDDFDFRAGSPKQMLPH